MARIGALCVHPQTRDLLTAAAQELQLNVDARLTAHEAALASARAAVADGAGVLLAEERLWTLLARTAPVAVVPCTAGVWEVLAAVARAGVRQAAVVHFGPGLLGLAELGTIVGAGLEEVVCDRSAGAVRAALQALRASGVEAVAGGESVVALARREGLRGITVLPGEATVRAALALAERLVQTVGEAQEAQTWFCRWAAELPAGVVSLTEDGSHSWGGKAPEVADRLRALVARGHRSETALTRALGPGLRVEALAPGTYIVHDLTAYEGVLARAAFAGAFGGRAEAAGGETVVVAVGTLDAMVSQLISELVRRSGGNRTRLARQLGISRTTLWKRLKDLAAQREG